MVLTKKHAVTRILTDGRVFQPNDGHAFILRRFDTGAISVSTMIRAAYPGLQEAGEKLETNWVRTSFDCAGSNGAGPRRLAGVWAPIEVSEYLARLYGLWEIIEPLVLAKPDPKSVPRRTTRSSAAESVASQPTTPTRTTRGKTPPSTAPARKRARGESPRSTASDASLNALSATSGLPIRAGSRSRASASPARQTRSSVSPSRAAPLRRSLRSPKPSTPTVHEADAEEEPEVSGPNMEEDLEESKAIVAAVKKAAEESNSVVTSVAVKRSHVDDETQTQVTMNISHHTDSTELALERPIASNRRVLMTPNRKAAAWGAFAFGIGLSAL